MTSLPGSPTAESLRFGLVGYSFGARYFHAPLIAGLDGVEFAGIVTTSDTRRTHAAQDHPGVPVLDSLAGLASAGIDAVAISTPAHTHEALMVEAIGHGLHVVCDKPFVLGADAARRIERLAADAGVVVSPYQNRRWDSDLLTLRRVLAEGGLGEVRRFESSFERFSTDAVPPAGGGLLYDFGSHLVDQALMLFGPVTRVYAETGGPAGGDEERFFASLTHAGGVTSHLRGDWRQGSPGPRFRVTGADGAFVVGPGMDGQEARLIAGRSPAADGDEWGTEPESAWGWIQHGDDRTPVRSERGRWDLFYAQFADAVRGAGPAPVSVADAVRSLAVLDACRVSADSGESVVVSSHSPARVE